MKTKLEKINKMSRDEAISHLKQVSIYAVGRQRTVLMEACESRIDHLNRDKSMVTVSDFK